MLTQTRLKEKLSYGPESGLFSRVGTGKAKVGTFNRRGYIHIQLDGKKYLAHRLVFLFMTGTFPPNQTDHINGVRDDNRWTNLREASPTENMRNAKLYNTNTSGVVGVCWDKGKGKWMAYIRLKGKMKTLGRFHHFFDAACARKSAEGRHGFHQNHGRN